MMRYLLLVLLVCALVWMVRGERRAALRRRSATRPQPPRVEGGEIVACALCDLHLPKSDALPSLRGPGQSWYCCDAHRRSGEA